MFPDSSMFQIGLHGDLQVHGCLHISNHWFHDELQHSLCRPRAIPELSGHVCQGKNVIKNSKFKILFSGACDDDGGVGV